MNSRDREVTEDYVERDSRAAAKQAREDDQQDADKKDDHFRQEITHHMNVSRREAARPPGVCSSRASYNSSNGEHDLQGMQQAEQHPNGSLPTL
jgi:hypothetical protein